jgi:hypothetical protein
MNRYPRKCFGEFGRTACNTHVLSFADSSFVKFKQSESISENTGMCMELLISGALLKEINFMLCRK